MASPLSSYSDSDLSSSESLSTTPSSVPASPYYKSREIHAFCLPMTCGYIPHYTAGIVKTIFDKHARGGRLGLYLDNVMPSVEETHTPFEFTDWSKQIFHGEGNAVHYYISTSPSLGSNLELDSCKPLLPTEPVVAQHLLAFSLASLRAIVSITFANGRHTLHILEQPAFIFLPLSHTPSFTPTSFLTEGCSKGNIPTPEEWRALWYVWDLITIQMIPREMLHQKPIDLRHKCLFYIGHIPTFLDMLIHKSIGGGPSEPKHFWDIFERGIDPHVDDLDHCHSHSEVPEADEDWPTLESIVGFRTRVRARLMQLYEDLRTGKRTLTRNIARTLVMTHEHEGFHVETLLYMLIQYAGIGTLPPPGFVTPPWELFAQQWDATPPPSTSTVTLGPAVVTMGRQDCEADDKLDGVAEDVEGHVFGWDNESPPRQVQVGAFRAEWRPINNGEFETFWRTTGQGQVQMPKSWVEEDGVVKVRTIYGPVSMDIARYWPVIASYDDILAYARSKGGRLPTEPELRLFLDMYDVGHEGGANVAFRNWHPVPATAGLCEYAGRGSNGGVWEWTSTVFDTHEGLSPTNLFTGYSTDFFDAKHQVVLGASYATIPRLAGRTTLRNFYQHNYPYAWVGGRVVYDV